MIDSLDLNKCVGCSVCEFVCPTQCISMDENQEGFLYPVIEHVKCIKCEKCIKVCQIDKSTSNDQTEFQKKIYYAIHKSDDIRKTSSSGGVFHSVANIFLQERGVVCAAVFDDNTVIHKVAYSIEDVRAMQGSKYAQSITTKVYNEVIQNLKGDKMVLFVGAPCQVAALKNLIPLKLQKNLFCIDFLCHGVPNNFLLRKYVNELQKKYKSKIVEIRFRDKKKGWKSYGFYAKFENGKIYYKDKYRDPYLRAFISGIIFRKCCYSCEFRNNNNKSDMTIGDFWKYRKYLKRRDDNKGISLVEIRTERAEKLLNKIEDLNIYQINYEDVHKEFIRSNVKEPIKRQEFFETMKSGTFEQAVNTVLPINYFQVFLYDIKNYIYNIIVGKKND